MEKRVEALRDKITRLGSPIIGEVEKYSETYETKVVSESVFKKICSNKLFSPLMNSEIDDRELDLLLDMIIRFLEERREIIIGE